MDWGTLVSVLAALTAVGGLAPWVRLHRTQWGRTKKLIARCETQNALANQGEPEGFYGRYPPAMGPFVPKPPEVVKKEAKAEKAERAPRRGTPAVVTQDMLTALQQTTGNVAIHNVVADNQPVLARCWTCNTPHQGPPGRCRVCTDQFAWARAHDRWQVSAFHMFPGAQVVRPGLWASSTDIYLDSPD